MGIKCSNIDINIIKETPDFKSNKNWLIPMISDTILNNPTNTKWTLSINQFKPKLIEIVDYIKRLMNININIHIPEVYNDISNLFIIRIQELTIYV